MAIRIRAPIGDSFRKYFDDVPWKIVSRHRIYSTKPGTDPNVMLIQVQRPAKAPSRFLGIETITDINAK